jgi:heme/copper-type cytochrome/quinol oxidase subunit 3
MQTVGIAIAITVLGWVMSSLLGAYAEKLTPESNFLLFYSVSATAVLGFLFVMYMAIQYIHTLHEAI